MRSTTRRRVLKVGGSTILGSSLVGTAQACRHIRTDWRTFQYDATNRGFVPADIGPSEPTPDIDWRFQTEGALHSAPAIINRLYFGDENGIVYSVSPEDGTEYWRRQLTAPITTTPTAEHDTIYIGTEDGLVIALVATFGAIRWCRWIDGPVSSPTVVEETVYITGGDGVHAFDARTGHELWHTPLEDIYSAESTPAVTPDTVYVSDREYVYALDATTGEEQWRYRPAEHHGAAESPPIIVDDTIYVRGGFERVHAIDATDGSQRTVFSADVSHIAATDRWIYAQHIDGLSAWSHDEESIEWSFLVDHGSSSYPAIAGDTVYYADSPGEGDNNTLHALDVADGTERWRIDLDVDFPFGVSLAVSEDTLYVPTVAGQLLAVA